MTRAWLRVIAALAALWIGDTAAAAPQRIVSLVPAVTEMLFAIGAGGQVVGVSSYDRHPPEVAGVTKVGGLLDPNVERILSLRPDLAIVYETQHDLREQLGRARIPLFLYAHSGLPDVFSTLREVGRRTGRASAAHRLASQLEQRIASVRQRLGAAPRPRTVLVFGREQLALRNIQASGGVGFLHDILEAAGARNVFEGVNRQMVQASTEMLLAAAPEVIVELHYGGSITSSELERERTVWNALGSIPAVRNGRVHLLEGDEYVLPGPRIAAATEQLARTLHGIKE